jgi:hypothetical protein
MQFRPNKRPPRRHRPRPEDRPEDVVPIVEPKPVQELVKFTLYNPRTGTNCVIVPYPGNRPGNLRVMVNGEHWPDLDTTTQLMAWLRRRLPRTSPKRAIPE